MLDDVSEVINVEFEEEEVSTISRYVFNILGCVPKIGDSVSYNNHTFEVIEMSGHRITKVKVVRNKIDEEDFSKGEK